MELSERKKLIDRAQEIYKKNNEIDILNAIIEAEKEFKGDEDNEEH